MDRNDPATVLHEKHTVPKASAELVEGGLNSRAPRARRTLAMALEIERRRIGEILRAVPEYSVPPLVHHLAFCTDTPAEVAIGIIAEASAIS